MKLKQILFLLSFVLLRASIIILFKNILRTMNNRGDNEISFIDIYNERSLLWDTAAPQYKHKLYRGPMI